MGTLPLRPEELDDETLFALDPIGILSESFAQVLENQIEVNEELALARDEIQAIFDSAGAGILVVDDRMRLEAFNKKSQQLFFPDKTEAEVLGGNFRQIVCEPELPPEECIFDRVLATRWMVEQVDFVARGRHFHVVGTPIKNNRDEITQVVLVYADITDRIRAEEALRESETRFRDLFENANDLIQSIAPDGSLIYVNRALRQAMGYGPEELAGLKLQDVIHPGCIDRCMETFGRLVSGDNTGGRLEATFVTKDGRAIIVEGSVNCSFEDGRPKATRGIFRDVTARKAAEQALRESEERFRGLYENAPSSYQSLDGEGRLLEVNQAYLDMLGYARGELLGRWVGDFMSPESRMLLKEWLPRFKAEGAADGAEFIMVHKDGSEVVVSVTGKVAYDARGRFQQSHCILHNITERKRAEAKIQKLAYFDALTDLPNRSLLHDRLCQTLLQAERSGHQVAVMFLDLDRFKEINDTLGHIVGDGLLKVVAERLLHCVRKSDTVARVGGDEFVIIQTSLISQKDTSLLAQKVLQALAQPVDLDGREVFTTASLGIAIYPRGGCDADALLKNADNAMYRAKEEGRNTYRAYTSDMNAKALERLLLGNDLRRALERGEFFLHYQPQVELASGRLFGMEALLRWNHPDLGLISPAQFIPLAEETGLILPIGRWVLETACARTQAWHEAGFPGLRVAVNLSGCQMRQRNLPAMVEEVLHRSGLDPSCLELELTESILMEGAEANKNILGEFKAMGVKLAIDDFGTGYSSLNYLRHFPIDRLKIDQSFVQDITRKPDDASAIAEAIVALARSLRLKVLAEGVETQEQLEFLRALECDEVQGYYFSRPVAGEDFAGLLRSGLTTAEGNRYRF
ncbi:MAG: GGDEF domain-containing protein [Desulfuromonas sp.]|uniref:sensor domain-containing protein n=1 Tax=Desulfuromonas sp. TaxID=892 RepID=UPI000CBE7D0B|nr:bifunctional diguanylate cyclase/phosphodiesterase [Desulfuromonas sp.]PLX85619.1 MAG: GGDEF domain-containing protein [Desulfuromonas sp.]